MNPNPQPAAGRPPAAGWTRPGGAAAIVLAGLWAVWPALRGDWIWDDLAEVAGNPVLRDPRGLAKIWFAPSGADYFPLKSSVQWLEWHLWGDSRVDYHLFSVSLHLFGALLFWRLLRRLIPGSLGPWLGGLLFALHPLAVESVAWIAEVKNTLSLPPLLLAMLVWVDRWDGPAPAGRARRIPFWAVFWFLIALLCKTSVVMFPVVLLLHAWWRRGRVGREDVRAALPFFALAFAFGLATLFFQVRHAIVGADLAIGGPLSRLAAAGAALVFYAGKFLLPAGLSPNYPRWAVVPPELVQGLPWLALAAIVFWLAAGRRRAALFGLGCFAVNLLPVLGLLPMAYLRIPWVADHFVYLPMLGLIGLAAAGAEAAADRAVRAGPGGRNAAVPLLLAIIGLLGAASRRQAAIYRGDEAFWSATVRANPASWLAQNDLGLVLAGSGRTEAAVGHYRESIRLRPDFPDAHNNLGNALAARRRLPEAIAEYREAIRLSPDDLDARRNLGNALAQSGRMPEAAAEYREVIRRRPGDAQAHCYLGFALAESGRLAEAVAEYQSALRLDPGLAEAHYRLGNALGNAGRLAEATAEYQAALRIRPGYVEARANLGLALAGDHRAAEAVAELEQAIAARPDYADGHAYLGYALAELGRPGEAVAQYQAALRLGPGGADLHYNLAVALRALGRTAEARAEFDRAAEISAAGGSGRP